MALILIIEDEAAIRANLVRFIELEGHQVFEAANGRVGLMNGREVLSALRSEPTLKKIPFVFLSASAGPERFEEARRLGAVDYITKPFNFAQLRAVLRLHLPNQ